MNHLTLALLGALIGVALAFLTGCTTEQVQAFTQGLSAASQATDTALRARDQWQHPEYYRQPIP